MSGEKTQHLDMTDKIGAKLAILLAARGVSQAELARRLGVSQGTVSAWLNGKTRLYADTVQCLARELRCSFDWLMDDEAGPVPPTAADYEPLVKDVARRKGWEWVYWRIIEGGPAGPKGDDPPPRRATPAELARLRDRSRPAKGPGTSHRRG